LKGNTTVKLIPKQLRFFTYNYWRFSNDCCFSRTENSPLGVATVVAMESSKKSRQFYDDSLVFAATIVAASSGESSVQKRQQSLSKHR